MLQVAKIGKRFQVVLPKEIRKSLAISSDDELIISLEGRKIIMEIKEKSFSRFIKGLGKELWQKGSQKWIREERDSWD